MLNPDRYAVLLRVRKQTEDLKARDLAVSQRAVQQCERERTSLELTRRLALEQAGENLRSHFDAADVRSYYQYERHLATLRDQKDAEMRALRQVEEEKRAVLDQATKSRRIAEKLDERRRARHRAHLAKMEQLQLDEVATMIAARDRQGRGTSDKVR